MPEYADEAGFYGYHLAEHQETPLGRAPSPGVCLAAVIQRTHRLRLGPLVYLLQLYNPLRLVTDTQSLQEGGGEVWRGAWEAAGREESYSDHDITAMGYDGDSRV